MTAMSNNQCGLGLNITFFTVIQIESCENEFVTENFLQAVSLIFQITKQI